MDGPFAPLWPGEVACEQEGLNYASEHAEHDPDPTPGEARK